MGRKKIEIDWDIVDEKLSHFCEGTEVAEHLGISFDTLERRIREEFIVDFAEYKRQKRAKGEMNLRELQIKSAKDGSITMLIWLGKQYLGQTDKSDHTSGGDKIQPLNITVTKEENTEKYKKHLEKLAELN